MAWVSKIDFNSCLYFSILMFWKCCSVVVGNCLQDIFLLLIIISTWVSFLVMLRLGAECRKNRLTNRSKIDSILFMNTILTTIQIISAILLIIVILLQNQGSGLSKTFGGSACGHTRRGAEKVLFYSTIVIAIIFFGAAVAKLLILKAWNCVWKNFKKFQKISIKISAQKQLPKNDWSKIGL